MADGAYDGEPVYQSVAERDPDAMVVLPPRITAVPSDTAETALTRRDRHIRIIADKRRLEWQREGGYGKRAKAKTAMARYKRILGLHARPLPGQPGRGRHRCRHRMIDAGRPDSVRIA
jgi:hypothetical protein